MTSPEMLVTPHAEELMNAVTQARASGKVVGLVPTMGALHEGHMSLVEGARKECDFIILTLFVNPTQFAPTEDLAKYPRPFEDDVRKCREAGVSLLFHPDSGSLYPDGFSTFVEVTGLSQVLEGRFRPTHFRGVTTIVLKLFNLTCPHRAYFGLKDYQQQLIIRRMTTDLKVPVEIVSCETIREPDGLAMSSRNIYLSETERKQALVISQSLKMAREQIQSGETTLASVRDKMEDHLKSVPGIEIDYAVIADADTLEELTVPTERMVGLIALRLGKTRLIDNMLLTE